MIHEVHTDALQLLHRGKVRDSFRIDDGRRLLVVTDRISAFDLKLSPDVPGKGAVLNTLSAWWFERTKHIVSNHCLSLPDEQAMLVREATPLKLEVVVRGYAAGSLWRAYEAGRRDYAGVMLPEGLRKHDRLPAAVLTPTTKEASDREISRDEALELGLLTESQYDRIQQIALKLYAEGARTAEAQGLLLADTKYEFGLAGDELILIDEIHTPDSSRYWDAADYARDQSNVESFDKDVVRRWMLANKDGGGFRTTLPAEIVAETAVRYRTLFHKLTGSEAPIARADALSELMKHLAAANLLRPSLEQS